MFPAKRFESRLIDQCDVIVLLSDYEGLPISLLEAMACGVVPVCLNIRSGIPELIEDGVTGLLVDDREQGFVEAIRRLNEDPQLWTRLSKAARNHVRVDNSLQTSAQRWVELLHRLHQASDTRTPVRVPTTFDLPPINSGLRREDARTKSLRVSLYSRTRTLAGSIKRMLAGESSK